MPSRTIFFCIILSTVLIGAGCRKEIPPAALAPPPPIGMSAHGLPQTRMTVNGIPLVVELARTREEKAQGLSGREELAEGMGMLFVFGEPLVPSFWMKDMKFDLDMIWIRDGNVVDISAYVPHPDSALPLAQLPTYSPHVPITYVLEVPVGWAERNGVEVGAQAVVPEVDGE